MHTVAMAHAYSVSVLSALSAHRFLVRAALAATASFAWVFVLQYYFLQFGTLGAAFIHTIVLYALAQIVTTLLTPYSAMQLMHGTRSRMVSAIFICIAALVTLSVSLSGIMEGTLGLICFAIFFGSYRALYWTPYILEKSREERSGLSHEFFVALMPAIAGYALLDGTWGATLLLFAGSVILVMSLAPLSQVPEMYERYVWGYRETFAELFEVKYNPIVEAAFIEGIQAAALLLLWPLAVFVIVGFSYVALGLVLTATLLLAALIRPYSARFLQRRLLLHAVLAASSWLFRLVVATPLGVIVVDAYASTSGRPGDSLTLEHAADNGTYLDEYTALKEIAQGLGRLFVCVIAALSILAFSLPVGLAVAFVLAAAASVVGVIHAHKNAHTLA